MVADGDTFEWVINLFLRMVFLVSPNSGYFLQLVVPHLAFIAMEGGSIYVSRGTSGASGLE